LLAKNTVLGTELSTSWYYTEHINLQWRLSAYDNRLQTLLQKMDTRKSWSTPRKSLFIYKP